MKKLAILFCAAFVSCYTIPGRFKEEAAPDRISESVPTDTIYVCKVETIYVKEIRVARKTNKSAMEKQVKDKNSKIGKEPLANHGKVSRDEPTKSTNFVDFEEFFNLGAISENVPPDVKNEEETDSLEILEVLSEGNGEIKNSKPIEPLPTIDVHSRFHTPEVSELMPLDTIKLWMVIYDEKVYAHRLKKFDYPGILRVSSHFIKDGHKVAIIESSFRPEHKWELIFPTKDGEYYVNAILLHEDNINQKKGE